MGSISVRKALSDLSTEELAAIRAVSLAVHPPEESASWPGRHLEWARPEWCICVSDEAGLLVTYAGLVLRNGKYGQASVRIGGIGGVMTHPEARGRGYAGIAMQQAIEFFRSQSNVDFALLVCKPQLIGYYGSLGWREFSGQLVVQQYGQESLFTFNRIMTHAVRLAAPTDGSIDLGGPPW